MGEVGGWTINLNVKTVHVYVEWKENLDKRVYVYMQQTYMEIHTDIAAQYGTGNETMSSMQITAIGSNWQLASIPLV